MKIFNIAAYGLIVIGILHFIVGVMNFGGLSMSFLWFISASMGLIYSGVMNIVFCRSEERSKNSLILVQSCNALNIIFGALALYLLREIQVVVILVFSVTLFLMWMFRR